MLRITLDEAIAYEEEIVERARSAMNFESVDSIDNDIRKDVNIHNFILLNFSNLMHK